jgi:hypothetical protein
MILCIAFHCIAVHYTTFIHTTWIHGYMNTWTHERMNTYIPTHTHTYLPTCMHATIQCNALQYHTVRYATLRDITYITWYDITLQKWHSLHDIDTHTHIYIYYTHVCVEHLNRCKTSTRWCWFFLFVWLSFFLRDALPTSTAGFNFNFHFRAGGGCMVWQSSTNEDTAFPWWYDEGTPLSRTCFIFGHGMWLTQEPPSRFISFHVICLRPLFKQFSNQTRTDEFQVNVRWEWFDSCF